MNIEKIAKLSGISRPKRMAMRSICCLIAGLVTVLTFAALSGCATAPEGPTPTPIPPVTAPAKPTYVVQRGEMVRQTEFEGRITPVLEQALSFRVSGRVQRILVQPQAFVTRGQLLADLDLGDLAYEYQLAQIRLEMARLNLEHVQAQEDSPDKEYLLPIRELELQLAQITFEQLQASVTNTQIIAPFDGQILSLDVAEGDMVEAFKSVMLMGDLSQLEVSASLPAPALKALSEGMPATIVLATQPGREIEGAIRRLPYPYGSGNRGEPVRLSLEALGFQLGDRVQVTVVVERKADALWLPPQAIRTFNGRTFVVVQQGGGQQRVDVEVGIDAGQRVEILSGLTEGQVVVGP